MPPGKKKADKAASDSDSDNGGPPSPKAQPQPQPQLPPQPLEVKELGALPPPAPKPLAPLLPPPPAVPVIAPKQESFSSVSLVDILYDRGGWSAFKKALNELD